MQERCRRALDAFVNGLNLHRHRIGVDAMDRGLNRAGYGLRLLSGTDGQTEVSPWAGVHGKINRGTAGNIERSFLDVANHADDLARLLRGRKGQYHLLPQRIEATQEEIGKRLVDDDALRRRGILFIVEPAPSEQLRA